MLDGYVSTYLREEVAAEALVRDVAPFADFLRVAALSDAEMLNFSNIARETAVSANTAKAYFQILTDTLIGRLLPAYVRRPKRRVVSAPKFYFVDVGVANVLARRGTVQRGGELYGKAFENWVCHELTAWMDYTEQFDTLAYWRLSSGAEVDFVVGDMRIAVEAKATERIGNQHLRGLRELARDHPEVGNRVMVCLEDRPYRTDDGILVLPPLEFCQRLYAGELG